MSRYLKSSEKNAGKAPSGIQSFFEPIIVYLRDVAQQLHSYYNDKPILKESKENQESILQSLSLVKLVISNGLNLLGIEALEKM